MNDAGDESSASSEHHECPQAAGDQPAASAEHF
jgi:hypothetical protein